MTVRKRGDTWTVDFRIRQGKGQLSIRHREAVSEARTKYEAEQAEIRIKERIRQEKEEKEKPPRPVDQPFADFVEKVYLPWAENNKKQHGCDRSILHMWVDLPSLKGKTVREVSQFDIEAAKIHRRRGKTRFGNERSPRTVNTELIVISSVFHRAIEHKLIAENPCSGVRRLETDEGPCRYLLPDEEERLIKFAQEGAGYLVPLITLGTGTGMRLGEMRRLRKSEVNFIRDLIFVAHPKWKNDPRRTKGIPISRKVREALIEWTPQTDSEYVFPSPQNPKRPIGQTAVSKALRAACQKAGLSGVGYHTLRHTFGTRLGERGERIEVIAELMGHADISMTRRYVHSSLESKRAAVEKATLQPADVVEIRQKLG